MSWHSFTLTAALCLALSVPGVASADDPLPVVEQRAGTLAPAEVSGLSEPARAGDPVAAAKAHLADPRYHLDPADLIPLETVVDGQDETVRFAQRYRGLPVFGAQYLVHFRQNDGRRAVVGAGGRFLTGLSVGITPAISRETAEKIVAAREQGSARAGELVVVPRGKGVLAWHVVLSGTPAGAGPPPLLDVYVDAHSGRPLFAVDRIRRVRPPDRRIGPPVGRPIGGPIGGPIGNSMSSAASSVVGSGRTADGRTVPLNAFRRGDGAYELRDQSRPMWNGTTGEVVTYDAKGADALDVLVPGVEPARSATPAFGAEHTETGAVDAHWGAGMVYEYYRKLGREGDSRARSTRP